MTKAVWTGVAAAAVLLCSSPVFAAGDTKTVTVTVHVNARAKLDLSATAVNFPDTDPDTLATLTATAFTVSVKARTTIGSAVSLDVSAPNFTGGNGGATLAIGNLSYASGGAPGFTASAPFTVAAASAGSWSGSGNQSTTHTYSLQNLWAHNTGDYTTTVTYTLTAP
jgi:hypothetical protein